MIIKRIPYGAFGPYGDEQQPVDVTVTPSTAAKGVVVFVTASVLAHIAVRIVDQWLFSPKR